MTSRNQDEWEKLGVFVGDEVNLARMAGDVLIHPGSRILGAETSMGSGCVVGAEAPAIVDNCQLGRKVELKGGYFSGAVFFDGANMGSGAHVRAGTLLEEEANGAHTVGLKQTILLPFVTLGSLINFCDVLMAGGTSRKNHSEVGSSYVHFNYTPHQDKATASLLGDVPSGVLIDQKPIFLGGQGGMVGPARMAYGSVVAAGGVCRKDLLEENQLYIPEVPTAGTRAYETGVYRNIGRTVENNLCYIGNIMALREWYRKIRCRFMNRDVFDVACLEGGLKNLDLILAERIKRLGELAEKMDYSIQQLEKQGAPEPLIKLQQRFLREWPLIKSKLEKQVPAQESQLLEQFLNGLPLTGSYIETIYSLDKGARETARRWLQSIIDDIEQLWR